MSAHKIHAIAEESSNESLESQREIRKRQLQRLKQRRLADMREHNVIVQSAANNDDRSGIYDDGPDELNELEMLAGIHQTHNQPLEISDDDELRGAEDPR